MPFSPHYVVMCVMAREIGPKISSLRVFQKDREFLRLTSSCIHGRKTRRAMLDRSAMYTQTKQNTRTHTAPHQESQKGGRAAKLSSFMSCTVKLDERWM